MIDPRAIVDPGAEVAADVEIGPFAVIGAGVRIGAGSWIGSHAVVKGPTVLGRGTRVFQFASIGDAPQDKKYAGEPTRLVVGDRNVFREFCSINRGTVSGRGDKWRNYNARNLETNAATGQPTPASTLLPEREDTAFSPRAALLYHVSDKVTTWGSIASGFRAPTLNELYRQFRVGAVLTLANDQLGPERLTGYEFGLNVAPTSALSVRTTWFDNRIKDPVANVTRPDLGANTRKRQNLGRTRVYGAQADVEYRVATEWQVSGGYMFNHARVTEFAASPDVVGRYLPQVPIHRGSIGVAYANPRFVSASFTALFYGRQYEDDLNVLAVPGRSTAGLPGYATAEIMVSRAISRYGDLFFGVQNLFNEEYFVGLLPTTVGSPRLVSGGFRLRLAGR